MSRPVLKSPALLTPTREAALGLAAVAAAAEVRWLLDPILANRQPFLFILLAVLGMGIWRGALSATAALIAGLPVWVWLFIEPRRSLTIQSPSDFLSVALYLLAGAVIIALAVQKRRGRDRAESAERSLREQQEISRLAAEASRMGVWSCDLVTGEVYWSPQLEAIMGLAPGKFDRTHAAFSARVHPDDRARVEEVINASVAALREYEVELRFIRADGAVRWMLSRGRPLAGPSGKPERIVGVAMDITERRLSEEALRRSDERFKLALSSHAVIVYEQDEQLRYRWVYPDNNAHHQRSIGHTDIELLGHPYGTRLYNLKKHVLETGVPARHEIDVPRAGGFLHYDLIIEPRTGPDGKVHGVIGAATDITARRNAEAAERAHQQRLDLALAAARMGIWSWDSRRQTLEWSKEMFALYQAAPGVHDMNGDELRAFGESLVHPDDLQKLKAAIARKLERSEDFEIEYRVRIGGEERWMCTRGQKVDQGDGHYQVLGVVMDITQRKEVEEELTRYRRELESIIAQRTRAIMELKAREHPAPEPSTPVSS